MKIANKTKNEKRIPVSASNNAALDQIMKVEGVVTVVAPAKLNLTLEVMRKCDDGYHEIRSIIQAIDLCDTLTFARSNQTEYHADLPSWRGGQSLVSKAVGLLRESTGCPDGVRIEVAKRIPLLSGLGGDSSDAAATLRGLRQLWQLRISDSDLSELAAQLGSDVPFFLRGGTALMQGRGELVSPLPSITPVWFVLVVPSVPQEPGKTRKMYQSLKPEHYTDGRLTQDLVEKLHSRQKISSSDIFNTFENIAFVPGSELKVYREHLLKVGASNVHLAGSGPTLFSLEDDRDRAADIYRRLQHQKMECYLTQPLAEIRK